MKPMESNSIKYIQRKPYNNKNISKQNRRGKFQNQLSPFKDQPNNESRRQLLSQTKQMEKHLGLKFTQQNISYIAKKQASSFISNRQDQSMDSFDKILIDVGEEFQFQDEGSGDASKEEVNYSLLYKEYKLLIKDLKSSSESDASCQKILKGEIFEKEEEEKSNIEGEDIKSLEDSRRHHMKQMRLILRQRLDEIKQLKKHKSTGSSTNTQALDQFNTSLRLLGANVSQIHEQQSQQNISQSKMDPIEQEFIEFVSNVDEVKINISNIEKRITQNTKLYQNKKNKMKHELNNSLKEGEQDEVVKMLENQLGSREMIQESLQQSNHDSHFKEKQLISKENYNHILKELDENQLQDKKNQQSAHGISFIISQREEWVKNKTNKTKKWKKKQLELLKQMKMIMNDPFAEWSEDQDFNLQI